MNHTLLQKASIVLTPTAYGADTLNAMKPAGSSADFEFTRNSTATRVNESGLIEDVPYNLVLHSQSFSSGWFNTNSTETLDTSVLAPDGTATAWKLQANAGTHFSFLGQTITMSGQISFSVFLKKGTATTASVFLSESGNLGLTANLENGTITSVTGSDMVGSVESAGNGWYRFEIKHTSGDDLSNSVRIGVEGGSFGSVTYAGTENIYIWGAQITKGDIKPYLKTTDRLDIPRIDYTNGEPSILLEPQFTNHYLKSEAFDNFSGTINLNNATSPTGATNAAKLTKTSASDQFLVLSWSGTTISTSTAYTMSLFVKHNGDDIDVRYEYNNSADWGVTWTALFLVRASGTTASTVANCTSKVEDFGNGWFRISCTFTTAGSVSATSPANLVRITGGDTETILVFGAQMEKYLAPTSYIPSLGTAVTRSQDVCGNAGSSDLINSTEGTLYAEIDVQAKSGGTFLSLSAGNSSNRVIFGFISSSGKFFITGSGSTSSSTFSITTGQFNKIALTYKANERKVFVNGSSAFSSTSSFSLPTGLSELSFDSNGTGSQDFEGSVKTVAVFKEALTDAELTTLTS